MGLQSMWGKEAVPERWSAGASGCETSSTLGNTWAKFLPFNPGPCLSLVPRGNLLPNLTVRDLKTCRFHPEKAPFCPILRVGDVVKFAGQDFAKLARTVRPCLLPDLIVVCTESWDLPYPSGEATGMPGRDCTRTVPPDGHISGLRVSVPEPCPSMPGP